ncbi:MAG: hypothetical protein KF817_13255 [Phycisphaeraceae bacterium]|nr:hypothetical protein [Phycisphaeraceae bacterium]
MTDRKKPTDLTKVSGGSTASNIRGQNNDAKRKSLTDATAAGAAAGSTASNIRGQNNDAKRRSLTDATAGGAAAGSTDASAPRRKPASGSTLNATTGGAGLTGAHAPRRRQDSGGMGAG